MCVQEVRPAEEFAPIKNAEGSDSPATSRAALVAQYQAWLEGTPLADELRGRTIEIDHAVIDDAVEAQELAARSPEVIRDAIRVATGTDA